MSELLCLYHLLLLCVIANCHQYCIFGYRGINILYAFPVLYQFLMGWMEFSGYRLKLGDEADVG